MVLTALMILALIANSGAVDSPVAWFKKVGARHVEFSLDGSRLIVWRSNELVVLDLDGCILLELPFEHLERYVYLSGACLNFNGSLAAVCLSEIFEVEGYEKAVVHVAVYSVDDGRLLWNTSREGFYHACACFIPEENRFIALYVTPAVERPLNLTIESLDAFNGSLLWKFTT